MSIVTKKEPDFVVVAILFQFCWYQNLMSDCGTVVIAVVLVCLSTCKNVQQQMWLN